MEILGSPMTTTYVLGILSMQEGHFNVIRLMGNSTNNLGHRLEAINSVSLISFHCATWTTETACAWGDTFMQKMFLTRPEINSRPLSLSLSYPSPLQQSLQSSHPSPSNVPLFPSPSPI